MDIFEEEGTPRFGKKLEVVRNKVKTQNRKIKVQNKEKDKPSINTFIFDKMIKILDYDSDFEDEDEKEKEKEKEKKWIICSNNYIYFNIIFYFNLES